MVRSRCQIHRLTRSGYPQVDAAKNLARSLVGSRKAKARIHAAKAKVNSVKMEMKNQLAILRISNVLEKSKRIIQSCMRRRFAGGGLAKVIVQSHLTVRGGFKWIRVGWFLSVRSQ